MRSLLAPLVIGLVLSLAAAFGIQWTMVRAAIDRVLLDYIADELAQDAEELYGSLAELPGGAPGIATTHFDPPFLEPHSGKYYQVLAGGGIAMRSPSLGNDSLAFDALPPGARRVALLSSPRGEELLLSATGHEFLGRPITIGVAADLHGIRAKFQRLVRSYTRVSLLMLAVLVALQVAIVRLSLASLRRVQSDVGRLERGEIVQLGERVPAEVLPLVREINRLLALLARRLQRSRDALGNLAHALKTPLSVLTHIAADLESRSDPTLARQMQEQMGILRGRIDTELRRARVAGSGSRDTALVIGVEIESLARTLRKIHLERAPEIVCAIEPGVTVAVDREDFLELCGNLMDNACKWARSRVRVTVRGAGGVTLTVEDDGPGCSPEDLARIARRGVRLDESAEGHGLGLAIAHEIAASCEAELRFGRSAELGGFAAEIVFPAGRSRTTTHAGAGPTR